MPKKFVHPDEKGSEGYPTDANDEEALRRIGYFEEGYPKKMYRDGEEPCEVVSSEEEKALGKGWIEFDEALRKIGGFCRERFVAAENNPAEQAHLLNEYGTRHPALAAADSWYKKIEPRIPTLQTQAMLNLVSDRQAEDRERRVIEAVATDAAQKLVRPNVQAKLRNKGGRPKGKGSEELRKRNEFIAAKKRLGLKSPPLCRELDNAGFATPEGWPSTWVESYRKDVYRERIYSIFSYAVKKFG